MDNLKKAFYVLFFVMVIGHVADYFSTYYVLNKMDFSWETNKYVKNNEDLWLVKTMALFHAISIIGLYHLIKDWVPERFVKVFQVVILFAYVIPTVILWKAVIVNIQNCFLVAGL